MADLKLVVDVLAKDNASGPLGSAHKAVSGFGSALGDMGKIAGGVLLGGGLEELPGKMLEFAQMAAEDEQASVRVGAILKTLPGDFDQNNAAVNQAIASGQKLAFSDDDIRDSFVKLAAATGDTEDALKKQQVAMDLARGAHIPLADASKLLGKLTDDNLQVFKKMGITLPDVASEADVLAAVQAKFAGQSEAYANSTAGQFEQAKIAMSETQEAIGYALLPVMSAFGKVLADVLPQVQDFVGTMSAGFSEVLSPMLEKFGGVVEKVMHGDVGGAIAEIGPIIQGMLPDIEASLGQWVDAFLAWVTPMIPPLLGQLADLAAELIGWLVDKAPDIFAKLAEWGLEFVEWVAPRIPPLLLELAKLELRIVEWMINTALPAMIANLIEWGKAFIEWVAKDVLPELPGVLATIAEALSVWVVATALNIGTWAVAMGRAFVDWVANDVLPQLPGALASVATAISGWINNTAASIGTWAMEMGSHLISGFLSGLASLGSQLQNTISTAINNIRPPALPSISLPSFIPHAAGGSVIPGQGYLVGEQGPELFMSGSAGSIVPNNQLGGGGGPVIAGDIVLQLDGRTLARVTREQLLQLGRRNGSALGALG